MSLKKHTVKSYDDDLKSISRNLGEMVDLVLESLDMVGLMIKTHDEEIVTKIRPHDYKINSLDILIEKKVTTILALRQPMAVDLRYIVSSLKVASNLERSGDQAKSIIKKIARVGKENFDEDAISSFMLMIELCKKMVQKSIESFNEQDFELAQIVLQSDDEIDNIYKKFFDIKDKESFSQRDLKRIINTLFIAKNFERLADHSTNIAEIAQFVVTGEIKQ